MDDLDDVVKRYTEECVSLLAESVQKYLKDLQEENAKLKAENDRLIFCLICCCNLTDRITVR